MVPSSDEMNAMHNGALGAAKTSTSTPAAASGTPTPATAPAGHDAEANVSGVEAIYVRNASKSYGVGKRRAQVLRSLDMNVKKGTIYGLLGASGCGKTTLLSCIVGRRSFDSGEVLVFGGEPGSPESGIPGPRVGYMPQELALYGEFTIRETLEYFGRIYRLPQTFVRSQMEFLFNLLDLPPGHRSVKTLSGGQQRRVSFAVALFHEPELLILDEPTVGVDPLLRQSIWNHLVRLSTNHGKTIIITTHYIEEARQAHTIGLMRSGHLLAEESPHALLSLHGLSSLEDVFLKLCMKDRTKVGAEAAGASGVSAIGGASAATATVVQTISNGKLAADGVDNPAFAQQEHDAHHQQPDDDDDVDAHKGISNLAMHLQIGAQYWKNKQSILPAVQEDGIVGLTFSPSGENVSMTSHHGGSNRLTKQQQQQMINGNVIKERRVNELNSLNRRSPTADEPPTAIHMTNQETKENLFHSGASSSSGQSQGDTTSSCGSDSGESGDTAHTSVGRWPPGRVTGKRRSRTFALSVPSPHRTAALIRKNFMQTFRNIGVFLFIFLLPAVQAILFCLAIGRDPTFLKVGVVNDELDPSQGRVCNYTTDCTYSMFSCRYLRHVDNSTILQVPFPTYDAAVEAASRGEVWGVVHFPQNFTDELVVRQSDGNDADNATIMGSQIGVRLDWSNQQISLIIQRRLIDAFESFGKDVLQACNYEPGAASIPLTFLDPIYGNKDPSFTEFMAPGLILTIVYFIAVALTAAVFINERKQGLLDRSLVAGVTTTEIMVAHLVNQFTVLVGQTTLVFIFMLLVFQIPCHGSLTTAVFITLLQGLCGMSYGFLVSSLCDEETSAIHLALGSFYPNLLLSGVMWPMEGMPVYLRYVSYFLPQTYAVESLRNIFSRAWGMDKPEVYWGVVISFGWIFALLALSLIVIRVRKYTG